jgi:hypothetical protein
MNCSKLALFGAAATLLLASGNAAFGRAVRGDEPAAEPVPSPSKSKSVSPAAAETAAGDTAALPPLRAGMSVEVDVDAGHARGLPQFLAALFGHSRRQS